MKGIRIGNKEVKLFQYADDTGILLDGSESSLLSALHLFEEFAKFSGLKPNIDKTQAIWLGSKRGCQERLTSCLEWKSGPFRVLGIMFVTSLSEMVDLNYEIKMKEIKSLIDKWSKRNLTPLGRITVVKTIVLSKLVHLFSCLPSPGKLFVNELQRKLFTFVWQGKPDRIARDMLVQDYKDGGLRMPHVVSFIQSLKVKWLQRLLYSDAVWTDLFDTIFPRSLHDVLYFGKDYLRKILPTVQNDFYRDVMDAVVKYRESVERPGDGDSRYDPMWHNARIRIAGQCRLPFMEDAGSLVRGANVQRRWKPSFIP